MRDPDDVTALVIDTAPRLERELGPGLLESVYEAVLAAILQRRGLTFERQKPVSFQYEGLRFDDACRVYLLVDGSVVVELKSVERLIPVHAKRALPYLRVLDLQVGLLINFGAPTLREDCGGSSTTTSAPAPPDALRLSSSLRGST